MQEFLFLKKDELNTQRLLLGGGKLLVCDNALFVEVCEFLELGIDTTRRRCSWSLLLGLGCTLLPCLFDCCLLLGLRLLLLLSPCFARPHSCYEH